MACGDDVDYRVKLMDVYLKIRKVKVSPSVSVAHEIALKKGPVQRGNLALDLKFSVAPAAAVSLVCYGEFENVIQIDSERNVVYDYTG